MRDGLVIRKVKKTGKAVSDVQKTIESTKRWTIYLFTCKLDGMIYVGQALDLRRRWASYQKDVRRAARPTPFVAALRTHGEDAFALEVLESGIETQRAADAAERAWIKRLGSNKPDVGWNRTSGGSCKEKRWEK